MEQRGAAKQLANVRLFVSACVALRRMVTPIQNDRVGGGVDLTLTQLATLLHTLDTHTRATKPQRLGGVYQSFYSKQLRWQSLCVYGKLQLLLLVW